MPRENKKRGRRGGDKKRKHDETEPEETAADLSITESSKRVRVHEATREDLFAENADYESLDTRRAAYDVSDEPYSGGVAADRPFYGMLDEDEQEYFRKADDMLETDIFGTLEERELFIENIFKEADAKELKMACSQSCSRLMERLINAASPAQLNRLFQKFNGNFVHLVQHRFASHCCERLFTRAAPIVTDELLYKTNGEQNADSDDVYASMEQLFLHTIAELEGDIGFLMTDRFASHALRVLLLVLAGEPLESSANKSILASKKKEGIVGKDTGQNEEKSAHNKRTVPKSFTEALESLMTKSIAGLNTQGLRTLALHPTGSPILQLLVRLELTHFGKSRAKDGTSILRTLVPEDPVTQESESSGFLNGLNYDPIGSHLLEVLIEHTPGKMFKNLYKEFWKDRMASLSRNDIAGFVVCKILERVSREDLIDAHEMIVPIIPDLIERNRVIVLKTLIQRCSVRKVDTQAIAVAIDSHFGGADGFDILKLLRIDKKDMEDKSAARLASRQNGETNGTGSATRTQQNHTGQTKPDVSKVQGSVLAQAMMLVPGPLSGLILDSMPGIPAAALLEMAFDPVHSRTIQATLRSLNASIIPRRKFVQQFYGNIGEMAANPAASHVVDAIWEGTHGLAFIRERIAEELAENEATLRESPYGRAVWKNWKMDLYKRRRSEWVLQSKNKASNDGFQSFEELDKNKGKMESDAAGPNAAAALRNALGAVVEEQSQQHANGTGPVKQKTPIEKARERYAARKKNSREHEARSRRGNGAGGAAGSAAGPATGANAATAA